MAKIRLFENSILWRIFKPNRDENLEEGWIRLHNEELQRLYHSPHPVRMVKSRRLRWAVHIARIEKVGVLSKFTWQIYNIYIYIYIYINTRRREDNIRLGFKRNRCQ